MRWMGKFPSKKSNCQAKTYRGGIILYLLYVFNMELAQMSQKRSFRVQIHAATGQ